MRKLFAFVATVAMLFVFAVPVHADSSPPGTLPPQLTCHPPNFAFPGQPGTGPCTETDHFSEAPFLASPLPQCPGTNEWAFIDATGNGVQHMTVNAAQDFWFTTTLAGPATIFPIVIVTVDQFGNPVVWHVDTSRPPIATGQLQQWFGFQGNNMNRVFSFTTNFQGTLSTGQSVTLHFNAHMNSTGANPVMPNLNSMHFDVTCS
jgi:hypothetical protein